MLRCDLNCDMGEGLDNEAALMPYISSANIACGFHAGDTDTMKRVVAFCAGHNVAIGAHPSYPDRPGFGRREMIGPGLQPKDVFDIVSAQLQHLQSIVSELGAHLYHVKPHGALYNRVAWDEEVAHFFCRAVHDFQPLLHVYGLSGSRLSSVAGTYPLSFVHEVFADRTYSADGTLTPRSNSHALIEDPDVACAQVRGMVLRNEVIACTGEKLFVEAQTICIHGDSKGVVTLAKKLHAFLSDTRGIKKNFIEKDQ